MKLITFAVPSYNSQDYLNKCIDSLIKGGTEVEVIIVNDGSSDRTEEIANDYVRQYPEIVRVINKPNGGHGSAINAGLAQARGLYFKVVDSDDWLDEVALAKLLARIKTHIINSTLPDLYITNFVYDKPSVNSTFVRSFNKKFKSDSFTKWRHVKRFYGAEVLLMHSLMYHTERLRESGIMLPHHTFYVDNIYAYKPLPHMKTIFYLDVDLYHYFIGRNDQSVNFNVLKNRHDQQIRVMKEMITAYSYDELMKMERGLRRYMIHCLEAIMITTTLFVVSKDEPVRKDDLHALWMFIKQTDYEMYLKLRMKSVLITFNYLPWKIKRSVVIFGYKFLRRRIKLG